MTTAKSGRPVPHTDDDRRAQRPVGPAFATLSSPYFLYLVALFVGVMIISNITGTKGVLLFPSLSFDLGPLSVHGLVLSLIHI